MCEGIVPGEMHRHVAPPTPHGLHGLTATAAAAAAAGASTAEMPATTTRASVGSEVPVARGGDGGKQQQPEAPCFPACMDMDKEVRMADRTINTRDSEEPITNGRRSRRNSRRLSVDNQSENNGGGASLDLEDVAQSVLSPVDLRTHAPAPGSIVVDYDEGMPERSRTGLLLREHDAAADCAPDACNPLDALAFDELAIEDMATTSRITAPRPRLGSASQPKTPRTPKTPSRRGKSVVLSSGAISLEIEKPLTPVNYSAAATVVTVTKTTEAPTDDPEKSFERCSKLHKLCLCEVRLHKTLESCWLVASGSVYDVTGLVDVHPAGPRSILRKAGGADCTKDMKFHSKAARKMMDKCFIGKLVPCGEDPEEADAPAACTIM